MSPSSPTEPVPDETKQPGSPGGNPAVPDGSPEGRRAEQIKKILIDADQRDAEAAARDTKSDEREKAADLKAFMDSGQKYPGHIERRASSMDRESSRDDRESSADDRAELAKDVGLETDEDS